MSGRLALFAFICAAFTGVLTAGAMHPHFDTMTRFAMLGGAAATVAIPLLLVWNSRS